MVEGFNAAAQIKDADQSGKSDGQPGRLGVGNIGVFKNTDAGKNQKADTKQYHGFSYPRTPGKLECGLQNSVGGEGKDQRVKAGLIGVAPDTGLSLIVLRLLIFIKGFLQEKPEKKKNNEK